MLWIAGPCDGHLVIPPCEFCGKAQAAPDDPDWCEHPTVGDIINVAAVCDACDGSGQGPIDKTCGVCNGRGCVVSDDYRVVTEAVATVGVDGPERRTVLTLEPIPAFNGYDVVNDPALDTIPAWHIIEQDGDYWLFGPPKQSVGRIPSLGSPIPNEWQQVTP